VKKKKEVHCERQRGRAISIHTFSYFTKASSARSNPQCWWSLLRMSIHSTV